MSWLGAHALRRGSLFRLALVDRIAIGDSVDKNNVLREADLGAILVTLRGRNFIASSVAPGLSTSGLILLAGLFRANLDLSTEGSVRLTLEVNDALIVLALADEGSTLDLSYVLDLGSGCTAGEATLGGPVADIFVAKFTTAVSTSAMSEVHCGEKYPGIISTYAYPNF